MKAIKCLRTPEELWELEEKHPLMGSSPAGLLRWMYATGNLNGRPFRKPACTRRDAATPRNGKCTGG
jgi:hypothetical protein